MARTVYQSSLDLPAVVAQYAASNTVVTFNNAMIEKHALSDEKRQTLLRAIESQLLQHRIQPSQVIQAIKKHFALDEAQQKRLATVILQEFCGSIRWWFDGLIEALAELGGELPVLNPFPVEQPKITVVAFMAQVRAKLDDAPKPVKQKIESYVQKLVAAEQCEEEAARKKLSSSVTEGGFGLSQQRAGELVVLLTDVIGVYQFENGAVAASVSPEILPAPTPPEPSQPPSPPPASTAQAPMPASILTEAETADVAAKQPLADELKAHPLSAAQDMLLENALTAVPLVGVAPELQQRYHLIISAHIAALRTEEQTSALLAEPESDGGMGLPADQAADVAKRIHAATSATAQKREEIVVMEKMASVAQQVAALEAQSPEARAQEKQKQLNEQFVTLFGRDAVAQIRAETHREIQTQEVAHPEEKMHDAPAITQTSQPTVAATPTTQQPPKYVPKVPDKLKALIDADAPILPIKKAAAFVPQKKAADIRPVLRLLGPIDELRTMSIVDFRRLSDDVSVRIQKIRSKIEVIAAEGAMEKLEAIRVFEQSEPVRAYRELLARSLLEGKQVADLGGELNAEEMIALAGYLQQIRYAS